MVVHSLVLKIVFTKFEWKEVGRRLLSVPSRISSIYYSKSVAVWQGAHLLDDGGHFQEVINQHLALRPVVQGCCRVI
jgi:hypothetical protein